MLLGMEIPTAYIRSRSLPTFNPVKKARKRLHSAPDEGSREEPSGISSWNLHTGDPVMYMSKEYEVLKTSITTKSKGKFPFGTPIVLINGPSGKEWKLMSAGKKLTKQAIKKGQIVTYRGEPHIVLDTGVSRKGMRGVHIVRHGTKVWKKMSAVRVSKKKYSRSQSEDL